MSKKTWLLFVGICVALLAGLVYIADKNKIDVSTVDTNAILPASGQSGNIADQVFGNPASKIVLVEYGDFQCPGCGSAHAGIKAVSEKYKDKMALVFRNLPLTTIHPNARAAAAAAEAAGLQGKYWQMHNIIFEEQSAWKDLSANERTDYFKEKAQALGLNVDTFMNDLTGAAVNQKISFDQALAKKLNVSSTPTFYLNGNSLNQGVWSSQEKLDQAIADELKKQGVN